jgi:hypothetical protein
MKPIHNPLFLAGLALSLTLPLSAGESMDKM